MTAISPIAGRRDSGANVMQIQSAGQIILEEFTTAIDGLKGCVTPILGVNEKNHAVLVGSAVLLRVAGKSFLCTAQHVLDENASSTLYVDGPSKLEILEGTFWSSPTSEHDIAVLELTGSQSDFLQKYQPLDEHHIASQIQAQACKYAGMVGFPETKNRKIHGQNKLKGQAHLFGGMVIKITQERVHIKFDGKRMMDSKTRQRVTPPKPYGISGGAIFGVPMNGSAIEGAPHPQLLGITTDKRQESKEAFGSSIAIVMAVIRDAYKVVLPARLNPENVRANIAKTQVSPATDQQEHANE
jgi:hypothetical protein